MHTVKNNTDALEAASRETGKGQSIPLQAWTDPEGSRRLRLAYFKTLGT